MAKKILGINASPRKGANTDTMLAAALAAAEETQGVETETIYLRDYDISPCVGCYACGSDAAAKADRACLRYQDGMDEIYPKLLACDGLILASPVYFGNLTGQMKVFMDRTEGLLRYGTSSYQYGLQHKVGGAIAVGGNRNAGEEFTILSLHYFMHVHDMIVVGSGGEKTPGCYLGGGGTSWPNDRNKKNAVEDDELGMKSARNLGRNVAGTLMLLK